MTPKQARFVGEYLIDLNATKAAIRSGYSSQVAGSIGYENLTKPHIQAAIEMAQKERSKRTKVTQDMVIEGLARVAFGDLRALFDDAGNLRKPTDLPPEVSAMLSGVEIVTVSKGEGAVEHVAKVKTNDRLKALELLGRHLGMFTDKLEHSGGVTINVMKRG